MTSNNIAVEATDLVKTFGRTRAVDGIDERLRVIGRRDGGPAPRLVVLPGLAGGREHVGCAVVVVDSVDQQRGADRVGGPQGRILW